MFRYRPFLPIVLLILLLAGAALAGPAVLVDHLHGHARLDRLEAVWPDAVFTVLGPQDHPIDLVLAEGVAYAEEDITITVPPGQDCLYGYFLCDGSMVQYPFIVVRDPSGGMVTGGYCGGFHVEDPEPGEWFVGFDDWEPELRHYVIGTGPDLLTTAMMAAHDAVVRVWDNTGLMFHGAMPEYSVREAAAIEDYLAGGGAHLFLREPLVEMALKPVIDLTSAEGLVCDLSIGLPGRLTYAEPPADAADRVATWSDVAVPAGATTQLLYEVAMSPPHHHLKVTTAGDLAVENMTGHALREVLLVRHLGGDRWLLAGGADLAAGAARPLAGPRPVARADLAATLARTMQRGGEAAGLSAGQMTAFLARYHWVDRLLLGATGRGGWTALYRVDTALCDALLPMAADPPAAGRTRTLWFWLTDIPDGLASEQPWPAAVASPVVNQPDAAASDLQIAEYGVIRQRYPVASAAKQRDQTWLGWTFHDDFQLVDPTDFVSDPALPLLHLPGGHPAAAELLDGLGAVGGVTCGGIVAPYAQQFVRGDDDTYTDDWFFAPGSFPPFAVGRSVQDGRAAAVASRSILHAGVPENATFLQRLLDWTVGIVTTTGDPVPAPGLRIAAYPNPFNPGTTITFAVDRPGPVAVTVHDVAGRRVARLFAGEVGAGEHTVAWIGRDDRDRSVPAGVYLLRVVAGDRTAARKLTLVE
ncbi:T9SS type A sorting domain-containing protein [bacterium]|nr:T9SS type A sorting domain-containing protein [bacterium]